MNVYKKILLGATAFLFGLAVAIPQAQAVPMLELSTSDGGFEVMSDTNNDGIVTFIGTIGSFTFNMTTGFTKPYVGTESNPVLNILSFNATTTNTETLTIKFSEDGFSGPVSGFKGELTGLGSAFVVTYEGFINNTSLGFSDAPGIPQSFSSGPITTPDPPGTYSLSQIITLKAVANKGGNILLASSMVSTPEPGTLLLFGSGLIGLGAWRWRKSQA